MKIKKVELTNIKCYSNAEFDFENGINFISGINGAGKTSIIESIGFALFDYKIGKSGFMNYFIKRGEKKAVVRIRFEDKDKEEYIVERKLTTSSNNSWIVKDIENEEEIVSGEIDVTNWLKDHLGFYRDDNISQIYENIISVPQGMFTSAFLDTTQNRKNKFDPIFNLEVYRTVFKNSASLESGLKEKKLLNESEKGKLNVKIDILKNDEKDYKELKKEVTTIKNNKQTKEKEYINLDKLYKEKASVKGEIDETEKIINIERINQENMSKNIESLREELKISNDAKQILEDNKKGYENYVQEEKKQKELQWKKRTFDTLNENKKIQKINIDASNKLVDSKNKSKEEIKTNIKVIENEIKELDIRIQKDNDVLNQKLLLLEQEKFNINELNDRKNKLDKAKNIIDNNKLVIQGNLKNIGTLEKTTKKENELLKQKEKLEIQIKIKEQVEKEKINVENKLNKLLAKIEHINESKRIAKDGMCPFLKSECINVKGKTEDEYNHEIDIINAETDSVKKERENILKQEKEIIKAETDLKNVISKIQEIEEIKIEIQKVQDEIKEKEDKNKEAQKKIYQILELNGIEKNLDKIEEFKIVSQKRQRAFNEQDKEYNILKTNFEHTKRELEKRNAELDKNNISVNKIENEIKRENENIKSYKKRIEEIDEELKMFSTIEKDIEENEKKLQVTKEAYTIYMQKKEIAGKAKEVKNKLIKSLEELKILEQKIKDSELKLEKLNKNYDEIEFKKLEKERNDLMLVLAEIKIKIEQSDSRLETLKEKLEELKVAKESLKEIDKKIYIYEKTIEYLSKIREIIKGAPEDISEILIQKVSTRATEMYSQIANDNTRLEWREGYEVILVDNVGGKPIEKEFRQLSGGEQMSAALAIRISMLEILTNLKIGILDEPTVNMDSGRRQRLAEIIESIGSGFIQLFVVSHDDTFNSITENTIQL